MPDSAALLLTPTVPGVTGNGLRMRANLLVTALRRLGPVHVVVVPVHGPEPVPASGLQAGLVAVTELPVDREADGRADFTARLADPRRRERAAALHPRPALCRPATLAAAEHVAALAAGASLIVVMRLYLAPYLDTVLDDAGRPPCVIDVDDVESSTRRQLGDHAEADRFERLERHYLPLFDRVLTCSEGDRLDLAARCGVAADVVPNAVEVPTETPGRPVRWDLVFVGNFSYGPNVAGARWLCRDVLLALPSATLALVGGDPAAAVMALGGSRVTVTGTVEDVAPFYAASRLTVVPLLAGGGTSIKLLEAFAHRRPVVSTSVGARGLPVRDGEHLLLADEAGHFGAACRRLLDDGAAAARLAAAGHQLVRQRFTVDTVAAGLAELLRSQAARAGQRP